MSVRGDTLLVAVQVDIGTPPTGRPSVGGGLADATNVTDNSPVPTSWRVLGSWGVWAASFLLLGLACGSTAGRADAGDRDSAQAAGDGGVDTIEIEGGQGGAIDAGGGGMAGATGIAGVGVGDGAGGAAGETDGGQAGNDGGSEGGVSNGGGDMTCHDTGPLGTLPELTPAMEPQFVQTADFDADGRPDLAVFAYGGLQLWMGKGDGTFATAATYFMPVEENLLIVDLNGDGKPELVGCAEHEVAIRFNVGDGTFGDLQYVQVTGPDPELVPTNPVFRRAEWLSSADFNGDGKMDLIASIYVSPQIGPNLLVVLLGNGDGSFQEPIDSATAQGLGAMTTGDFDHDGIADVVTVGQSVSVLLGDGAGGFRAPVISPGGGQPFIVTGDFDADGTLDLAFSEGPGIVGQNDPSQVVVVLGNGDGSFQAPVQYPVDDGAWSLSAGDFDGDGKADLAALATGSNVVIVLVGNGDGTFRPAVRSAATSAMIGMVAADFDLDHKLDVAALVRYNNANAVALIRGRGDGRFGAVVDSPGPGVNESVAGMITADVDGDGKIDLIGTQPGEDGLLIWLGRGDGSFRAPRQVPAGRQPMSIAQADLNGDGKIDLVTTNVVGHDISVLLGTGDGTFQDPVHHPVAGDITAIVVSDVNGDGRPDLMLSVSDNGANERLALMLNTGSDFADPVPICAGVSAPLVVADLDGDGDVDLIVAKPQDGVLRVLLGNGDGTFTANLTVLSSWSPLAGDFDQDGKLDLAFCGGVGPSATAMERFGPSAGPRRPASGAAQVISTAMESWIFSARTRASRSCWAAATAPFSPRSITWPRTGRGS